MTIPLSNRARNLQPSATFKLARRAQELKASGKDVLSFGLGEPDFDTPARARAAAQKAIEEGQTHYTSNEGIPALRKAIVEWFRDDQGILYDAGKQVLVTAGGKQAIANALLALIQEGDEVLVPSPFWLTYPEAVTLCDGVTRYVPTRVENGFRLTADELEAAITERSKVLILNSPNNPTGAVIGRKALEEIAAVVVRHGLYVLSDEIYGPLVFGDASHHSIAAVSEELRERTVVCHGVSKAFAMTGWRLGFALGPSELIGPMGDIQSHTTSNACSISQYAALGALTECRGDIAPMREEFGKRRTMVLERCAAFEGFELTPPEGAFYVFPRVSSLYGRRTAGGSLLSGSASFCEALLNEALISVVPGNVFGADDCFRLSYAASMEHLRSGMDRIGEFLAGLT